MNAPFPTHVPRDRDADRKEAERLVGELYKQVTLVNETADVTTDPVALAELNRLSTDLRFAADLLFAYQAGLAVSTPHPATGLLLIERIAVVAKQPPAFEVVLIWMADKCGGWLPWLGHMDDGGNWWYVDRGFAKGVTHWAYRPGVKA